MKRFRYLFVMKVCFFLLGMLFFSVPAAAINPQPEPPGIQVFIDGNLLQLDVAPVLEQGRTLVPLRAIFEALGAEVEWEQDQQRVAATKGRLTLSLQIGSRKAQKNGIQVDLDVPAKILDNRTMVPLRFVGEALGAGVVWDGEKRRIAIASGGSDEPSSQQDDQPDTTTEPNDQDNNIANTPGGENLINPNLLQRLKFKSFVTLPDGNRAITLQDDRVYPLMRLDDVDRLKKMAPLSTTQPPNEVLKYLTIQPPKATVDLRQWQTDIRDQDGRNTCVSFSLLAGMEASYRRLDPVKYANIDLSEQYAHHIQKMAAIMDDPPSNPFWRESPHAAWGFSDVYYATSLFLKKFGIPTENSLPYVGGGSYENTNEWTDNPRIDPQDNTVTQRTINDFNLDPARLPLSSLESAGYRITAYITFPEEELDNPDYYEAVLSAGYEVVFAMGIYSPDPTPDDAVWNPGSKLEGYHAMLIVGYDDQRRVFIVKNSWGFDNPLENGYTLISYDYITSGHVPEALFITGVENYPNQLQKPEQLFVGRWNLDHDGWQGILDIYRLPGIFAANSLHGQNDRRIGTYFHHDGTIHNVNGSINGNKIEFYIDFDNNYSSHLEYGEYKGKKFTGYLFTREPKYMAGTFYDTDTTYGFYATREDYLGSTPVSGIIDYSSYLGTWAMDHDGWQGKLEIFTVNPDNGSVTGKYATQDGKELNVTGTVLAIKRIIFINIPFVPANPQQFIGFLHSWERGVMTGTTKWNGKDFGFVARRTGGIVVDLDIPNAPSNLMASATNAFSAQISWQDNSDNETAFLVERKTGNGSFSQVAALAANTTSFTNTNLSPGTTYTYRVRARKGVWSSNYSNIASVTIPTLTIPPRTIIR